MKWTPRQKEVIDARGSNLLVSAAAGSGKTAVLVERIINLICDEEHPVDIDHLLVMTFTNAAAAEMRERISQAIERKLEEEEVEGKGGAESFRGGRGESCSQVTSGEPSPFFNL